MYVFTWSLNSFLHHLLFISLAIFVGGIWSAMKPFLMKSCLLPQWWHPTFFPSFWMLNLCDSVATGDVEMTENLFGNKCFANTPVVITLEGTMVENNRCSNATNVNSPAIVCLSNVRRIWVSLFFDRKPSQGWLGFCCGRNCINIRCPIEMPATADANPAIPPIPMLLPAWTLSMPGKYP